MKVSKYRTVKPIGSKPGWGGARVGAGRPHKDTDSINESVCKEKSQGRSGVNSGWGGARVCAGRPRKNPKQTQNDLVVALGAALLELETALADLRVNIRIEDRLERTRNSISYAKRYLERVMVSGAELPPALIEAKRLHLQIRRFIGYGVKTNEKL